MVCLIDKRQENVIKTGLGDKFVTQMNCNDCNVVLERFIVTSKMLKGVCSYFRYVE